MRKGTLSLAALLVLIAACQSDDSFSPAGERASARRAPPPGFAEQRFVDYAKSPTASAGLTVTTEGDDYSLFYGGARWFAGDNVQYAIEGTQPITNANKAVTAGVATVDGFVTTRTFSRRDATSQTNPCTGLPNTIAWTAIDGPGKTVAATTFCFFLATKEIVGFDMIIDQSESWSIGSTPTTLDVQNVATHEFGHAVGLAHVQSPLDVCLTMYPFVAFGEIQKRTLGLGDKLGMQALYNSTDVSAGSCGS